MAKLFLALAASAALLAVFTFGASADPWPPQDLTPTPLPTLPLATPLPTP